MACQSLIFKSQISATSTKMRLRLFVQVVLGLTLICCCEVATLWAGIAISPAYVNLDLSQKRISGQFTIKNTGSETIRYRIMATHFTFSEQGGIYRIAPDENSLAPWLKFNPKEFSLGPKTHRLVRFILIPRGRVIPKKEYWGSMELLSLDKNVIESHNANKDINVEIEVSASILVPIFASKGEVVYDSTFEAVRIVPAGKGHNLELTINSIGGGRLLVAATYQILDQTGAVLFDDKFKKHYILPGSRSTFSHPVMPPASLKLKGEYTVRVQYTSTPNAKKSISKSIQYTW